MRVTLKQMGTVFEDLHYGSNLGGSNALFDRSDILFQNKGDLSINKKKRQRIIRTHLSEGLQPPRKS